MSEYENPLDPKQLASTDKAPLDLTPPVAEEEIAHVLKLGADKYGVYNWRDNIDSIQDSTYYGAVRRHINAMMKGESLDPESQRSHWAHIGATAMIMLDVINEREKATQSEPEVGTRWTRYGNTYLLCCLMSTQFALINIGDGTSFTDRWHESELEAFAGDLDQFTQVEGEL